MGGGFRCRGLILEEVVFFCCLRAQAEQVEPVSRFDLDYQQPAGWVAQVVRGSHPQCRRHLRGPR